MTGKNVPEKSVIGTRARVMNSKSCQERMNVVSHMPSPAKASPMSRQAGRASSAAQDCTSPIAAMRARNPVA